MFSSKKQKSEAVYSGAEINTNAPSAMESRGRLLASCRFRGWVILALSIVLICVSGAVFSLASRPYVVVGIDHSGRPEVLNASAQGLSPELYARDFISCFLSYSPENVGENMKKAKGLSTDTFYKSFGMNLGGNFPAYVRDNNITQITSISQIQTQALTENGFTIVAKISRIKNDSVSRQTISTKLMLKMTVKTGPIRPDNPWGWYVDTLAETEDLS